MVAMQLPPPLIAVDIGNTNVHLGLRGPRDVDWTATFRFSSTRDRTPDEWQSLLSGHLRLWLERHPTPRVVASSVVPSLGRSFDSFCEQHLGVRPMFVTSKLNLGITVATDQPGATGADRIVNAAAAFAGFGGPVIVIDTGTATKVDAITGDGELIGGAIAPGLGLTMEALASRAAQLHAVPLEVPPAAIGRGTISAVQAGVVLGHARLIDGLVAMVRDELGTTNTVVMTGGHASLLAGVVESATTVCPNLTLDGLAHIATLNEP